MSRNLQDFEIQFFGDITGHCIRAPPKLGSYWEIHPIRLEDFPGEEEGEARGKSLRSRDISRALERDFPFSHHW